MIARKKKKKYTRKRDAGELVYIGVEISPTLGAALNSYCRDNGVKKRFVVEQALQAWCRGKGITSSTAASAQ